MSAKNILGLSSDIYEKLYNVWKNMISRCYNTSDDRYYTYGAKGVTVCEEWRNDFRAFAKWANDNGWKPTLSIERKNTYLNYCPQNCTFITMKEQARNKRNNIRIVINGENKCLTEWCEIYGVKVKTAHKRYRELGISDPNLLFYRGNLRYYNGQLLEEVSL